MKRGDIYYARLDPTEGSEQAGTRPVVIVSPNTINEHSSVILTVPCTTYRRQRVFRTQVLLPAGEGRLEVDSVAMAEQARAIDKRRLGQQPRGTISLPSMRQLERALLIALDLPGQV
ncbi:MAG: type II toxin-antitoxin system PemK/MazF family toxin [Dehalococcoidia bacterium]|nr:type II toxin-antitoxin system PemK/MazF family toxin [Dehalococcoidia bacterium]MSQ16481.1 type II toxin-antitoxin system PemK/MazF family toxin [Dehalococcoidia bacterium]